MHAVGIKALKNRLSEFIRLARQGETVLVTDRDRVVAELVPPREGRSVGVPDAFLAELVRTGCVTAPRFVSATPPPRIPVQPTEELLADLARDRAER